MDPIINILTVLINWFSLFSKHAQKLQNIILSIYFLNGDFGIYDWIELIFGLLEPLVNKTF